MCYTTHQLVARFVSCFVLCYLSFCCKLAFLKNSFLAANALSHLKEMVLRALSATARACSIWVAWRWWAMYWSQSRELLGEARSKRSKEAASSGRRWGSISSASRCRRAFSAAFFCCSSSWRDFFWGWQTEMITANVGWLKHAKIIISRCSNTLTTLSLKYVLQAHLTASILFLCVTWVALLHCRGRLQGAQPRVPGETCSYLQPGWTCRAVRHLLRGMKYILQILDS